MEASEGVLERELTEMGRRVRLSDADTTINSSSLFSVRDGLKKYQSNLLYVSGTRRGQRSVEDNLRFFMMTRSTTGC